MSATAMEQLYQQVILDHSRMPNGRGFVDLDPAHECGESHQINPTCGDEVTLRVELAGSGQDRAVKQISWEGQGCSISQASLSVMTELTEGQSTAEVERLGGIFRELMNSRGKGLPQDQEESLGDATAFTGVSQYPARIKCALLGWAALRDAVVRAGVAGDSAPSERSPVESLSNQLNPQEQA